MDKYRLIEALGITVVPVSTLKVRATIVEEHDVALIRPDLTAEDYDQVADWLLDRALACPDSVR